MSDTIQPPKLETAKLIIEVRAGIVPGTAMNEHTNRWGITSAQYDLLQSLEENKKPFEERSNEWHETRMLWLRVHGESREYQAALENPGQFNWTERTWLWL